jgi:hypothetical protein
MSGVPKTKVDIRAERDIGIPLNGLEIFEAGLGIFQGIKRLYRFLTGAEFFSGLPFRVHLLDMGAILEHDPAKVKGGLGAEDLSPETFFYQTGKQTAVVDMGVGQEHIVQLLRPVAVKGIVAPFDLPAALKHAAVD